MALALHFDATGEESVERVMLGMSANFADASPVLKAVADVLRGKEEALFASEDDWVPLAQSTLDAKARNGYPPDILQETQQLMKSLTTEGLNHINHTSPDTLIFGTSDPKAKFHRTGTSTMPKRDPLQVTEADEKVIAKMIQRFIVGAERSAFGMPGNFGMATTNPFGV